MEPGDRAAQIRGELSEQRLFAAILNFQYRPGWFVGVIRVDFEYDLRGVDAIAYIKYPDEDWCERVPIQIKSSWGGRSEYIETHGERGAQSVVIIVVTPERTDAELRRIFFGELSKVRKNNIRYHEYFAQLLIRRLTPGAERVRQHLVRVEMHRAIRRTSPRPREEPATATPPATPPPAEKKSWWRWIFRR